MVLHFSKGKVALAQTWESWELLLSLFISQLQGLGTDCCSPYPGILWVGGMQASFSLCVCLRPLPK